jgi:hypothetical protein
MNTELINFIKGLKINLKNMEATLDDTITSIELPDPTNNNVNDANEVKFGFEKNGRLTTTELVNLIENKPVNTAQTSVQQVLPNDQVIAQEPVNANQEVSDTSDDNVANQGQAGGKFNFSDTSVMNSVSSVNGSFLNKRMNKYLRNSMTGGGTNSDTLASITELQVNPMPRYNSQGGGGSSKMSKNDFLKKMHDAGITSSTSEFC